MKYDNACVLPFNLTDPEGLAYDEDPGAFVDLNHDPIIFSVRGLAYFSPRFKHAGIQLFTLHTRVDFERAYDRWMAIERSLLCEMVEQRAAAGPTNNEHQILKALWHGDLDKAEDIARRIDHRKRAALRIVAGSTREA